MGAARGVGIEAPKLLVIPPRAGFEALQPGLDAVLDGRVVADVEVQVPQVSCRPPITAVENIPLGHVEGASDGLVALASDDEDQSTSTKRLKTGMGNGESV